MNKSFPITAVSRTDILTAFDEPAINSAVGKRVKRMSDAEMSMLASNMEKIYVPELFWGSLKDIFTNNYLKPKFRSRIWW